MLVFRLFRVGKINQPSYKIVVADKRNSSRGGRFVEEVGFYNPVTKERVLNKERAKYWLSQGVQPSATVHNFFIKEAILEGKRIPKHKKSKKAPAVASAEVLEGKPAAAPAAAPDTAATEPKPAEKPAEAKPAEAVPAEAAQVETPKTEQGR